MGLQKYRADKAGEKQQNGGTPYYTHWMGGPTLALVRDCKIVNAEIGPRTVYVRGVHDTFFSMPAACRVHGKTITGWIGVDDNQEYVFHVHTEALARL